VNGIDWSNRLISVFGARGVGKTTLLLQHLKEDYKKSCMRVWMIYTFPWCWKLIYHCRWYWILYRWKIFCGCLECCIDELLSRGKKDFKNIQDALYAFLRRKLFFAKVKTFMFHLKE